MSWSWKEKVAFMFLLLELLYIDTVGSYSTGNRKEEQQRALLYANIGGEVGNVSLSHDVILGAEIGYDVISYSAIYELAGNGGYLGGGGRFNIYGVSNLTEHEIVTTAVWIYAVRDATVEVIQAGWHVNPALYHDSATRFFTRWTSDGYVSTGCYNTQCGGFVKVENAPLSPGDLLPISTVDAHHDLRIWIEKDHTQDWWLYASTDGTSSGQVGYWPQSLFAKLAHNASDINFGGLVQATAGSPSPPMGNGNFPRAAGSTAAFFAEVAYADQSGHKVPGILPSVVTNKGCYDVGDLNGGRFAYGGPGGCIRR